MVKIKAGHVFSGTPRLADTICHPSCLPPLCSSPHPGTASLPCEQSPVPGLHAQLSCPAVSRVLSAVPALLGSHLHLCKHSLEYFVHWPLRHLCARPSLSARGCASRKRHRHKGLVWPQECEGPRSPGRPAHSA